MVSKGEVYKHKTFKSKNITFKSKKSHPSSCGSVMVIMKMLPTKMLAGTKKSAVIKAVKNFSHSPKITIEKKIFENFCP